MPVTVSRVDAYEIAFVLYGNGAPLVAVVESAGRFDTEELDGFSEIVAG